MASTVSPDSPARQSATEDQVSLVRLYVLRAMYLLLVVIPWGYAWRHYVKRPSARWR